MFIHVVHVVHLFFIHLFGANIEAGKKKKERMNIQDSGGDLDQ